MNWLARDRYTSANRCFTTDCPNLRQPFFTVHYSLFINSATLSDVKYLLLLVVCILLGVGSFWADGFFRQTVLDLQGENWRGSAVEKFYGKVRVYGDWPYLMLYGGVGLLVAWRLRNVRWKRVLLAAMIASTAAGTLANVSRLTTGRTRPRADLTEVTPGFYGPYHDGKFLVGNHLYNSFPSGHTATAFGFAVPVVCAAPVVGAFVLVGAALVAWSSMMMGAHHFSDVAVSVLLSLWVGVFVWRRFDGLVGWVVRVRRRFFPPAP